LSNYRLPDKLKDAHAASVEIGMLMRSIRDAVEAAEASDTCPYGILRDARVPQREAVKIQLLAKRISTLVTETDWPTRSDLLRLDPETAAMLLELAEESETDDA
jgi:hypothetical protein